MTPLDTLRRYPLSRDRDHGDVVHNGSPDLAEFPPSAVERFYADWATLDHAPSLTRLREIAMSSLRVQALLRDARRRRAAERVIGRVEL